MSKRRWLWSVFALSALAALGTVWQFSFSGGLNVPANGNGERVRPDALPIRQVVLFNSGVGYLQREGEVDGKARVDLSFPANDINDLLKSLILQDAQGKIGTVSYDSHEPIDRILHSFALDLNNNPTFGQILNQARGELVEIGRHGDDKKPAKLTGTIVGMETQKRPVARDAVADVELVNLATPAGIQSIPLEQVVSVKFMNPVLESEFTRALKVLAGSHDTQKKTVSIAFQGEGKRTVRVGYVVERPIWKTSYRLRLEPNGKVFMQAWAMVENTSDDDWTDVRMVLVSGKPISYKMNLYEPLYIPRPEVEPELFASLRPPVYGGAMGGENPVGVAGAPPAPPAVFSGAGCYGGQAGYSQPKSQLANNYAPMWQAKNMQGLQENNVNRWRNETNQLQDMLNKKDFKQYKEDDIKKAIIERNRAIEDLNTNQAFGQGQPGNRLTYEQLQQRRQEVQAKRDEAKKAGSSITGFNFKEGIASVATAEEVGDYFQYVIDQKISLARQKSAMLPILDGNIEGTKVSIFNEAVHAKFPLLGLKLKNTSGKPLTQGPITVYDEGTYAGDTRILDLQPNEERLLSYALDQGTEVKTEVKMIPSPEMTFKIGSDSLTARFSMRQTKTYTLKNRSPVERIVILEHPIRADWKLVDAKKPSEKTRDLYRFQVSVPSGKTVKYAVVEDQARLDTVALIVGVKPVYSVAAGIEVKPVTHIQEQKLVALRIAKGVVLPKLKVRESKTYFIQNLSEQDREFTVDHVVRPDWVRLGGEKDVQKGPDVFRFKLAIEKGKTGQKEIVEERTFEEKGKLLKDLSEAAVRTFLANPATSNEVKINLTKALGLNAALVTATKTLADLDKQMKASSEDQTRMRANLQIIPQTSDHYKKFLEKFVAQETEIENLQKQIRTANVAVLAAQREYDQFVANLNAE